MENQTNSPKPRGKGLPIWTAVVIGACSILLTLIAGFILLWVTVLKPARDEKRIAEQSIAPAVIEAPTPASAEGLPSEKPEPVETEPSSTAIPATEIPATETPTEEPMTEPTQEPTTEPTQEPTTEPTAAPTPTPTEKPTPTPAPTKVPDSFKFGGKTIKRGTKKIDGSKLGINGKSGKPRHIKKEEVEALVALCPNLEELSLDYCYMDDYEPLGALTKLKTLKLRRCGEGGGNAVTDISWVKNLKSLSYLHLGHNSVRDVTPLKGLKKLTRLNLAYNDIDNDDLDVIAELTTLTELYLYGNKKVTDVAPLTSLKKLTFIHLGYNNKLKNIKKLTELPKLKSLRINKTNISDVSYFKNFPALERLDISGCPILFKDYYDLQDCKKLKLVVLDNKDTDASLALDDMINNGFGIEILYEWP